MSFADDFGGGSKRNSAPKKTRAPPRVQREIDIDDFAQDAQPTLYNSSNKRSDADDDLEYRQGSSQSKACGDEIVELMSLIYKQTQSIETISKKLGTPKDTHEVRHNLSVTIEETSKLMKRVSQQLQLFEKYANEEEGETRLRYNKLREELKSCMDKFKKQVQTSHAKEKQTVVQDKKAVEQMKQQKQQQQRTTATLPNSSEEEDEKSALLASQQQQQQKLKRVSDFASEIDHNEMIISEREVDIREIEASIRDVQDVFRELSFLVNEQGEQLDLIENNVEDAGLHVKKGVEDVKTANNLDKKGRNLLCILLIIVLIAAIGITIILLIVFSIVRIF